MFKHTQTYRRLPLQNKVHLFLKALNLRGIQAQNPKFKVAAVSSYQGDY